MRGYRKATEEQDWFSQCRSKLKIIGTALKCTQKSRVLI
jgi:hypothetical protein